MKPIGNYFSGLAARLFGKRRIAVAAVLMGLFSLWLIPEKIGHTDSSLPAPTASFRESQPLPALRGQEAIDHLKQQGTYDSLQEAMAAARYEAQWQTAPRLHGLGPAYELKNAANHLLAYVNGDGLQVTALGNQSTTPWQMGLKLEACGYGDALSPLQSGEVKAQGNRVEIKRDSSLITHHSSLTEWFVNTARGIEHGFDIAVVPGERKEGERLRLRLAVTGDLAARVDGTGRGAAFSRAADNVLLGYNKLFVMDAKGRALEARMEVEDGALMIEIEDGEAEYPLTIDPLLAFQQKLTASDGAPNDQFGHYVAISGNTAVVGSIGTNNIQGTAYVFVRSGATWTQQQELTASDGAANDSFGVSVAISGDTLVVGANGDDVGTNNDQGSAYVFTRSGTFWTQQAKLTAADGVTLDTFGLSVAISSDTVVVGVPFADVAANSNQGAAYVFVRSGTSWTQQAKLIAADGATGDFFGNSVGISNDTVVVGAPKGAAYVFVRSGTSWMQQAKLTASDGAAGDLFGVSVAINGDTIVAGAVRNDVGANTDQGAAYVFVRSSTTWTQQQKLTASDGATSDQFGVSVTISGDTIAVSAYVDDVGANTNQGSAYVFTRSGTTWTQQQILTATDGAAFDEFGVSVAISGDTVVVGAEFNDATFTNQGSVYVFVCTWSEQFHATASDGAANDLFGTSVAISGDTVVVGAPFDDIAFTDQGSAYVFVRSGATWAQQQKLTAADGAASDLFGRAVAIHGDTLVVGAVNDDVGANTDQGSAYVFVRSGTAWSQQQKLTASDGATNDLFGTSVAISGDTVICGAVTDTVGANVAQGSAYVFVRSGVSWTQQAKLTASDGAANDWFGYSVAISGDTLVVGSPQDDSSQGSAYVFVRSNASWTQQQKLTASDPGPNDQLGFAVAISGDTVVAGAVHDVIGGNQDQGSAYVFVRSGTTWSQQQKIVAADGLTFDQLGVAVAINGDTIVLGAQADDETIMDQGSAYIYQRSGVVWTFRQKLVASDAGNTDLFGFSVAISGNTIVVGAYRDDVGGNSDQGSAYVFYMGCNTAPVIVASSSINRQQGSPTATAIIATVFDSEDPIGYLTVSVASAPAGIAITNLTNANGTISASIAAACDATPGNNIVTLRVQDSDGAIGSVQLLVNVTANTLPSLGSYADTAVGVTASATVTPSFAPFDNGSIVSFSATSPTFAGTLGATRQSGTITIANARPGGTHVVTVTAVDNCGDTISTAFVLTVACQSITVNPTTIPNGIAGSAYSQTFTQTGGNGTVTFALTGTLPTGMSFNAGTATLAGTPTQVGGFPLTVTATDQNSCSGSRNYTLTVGASLLTWNGATSSDWHTASNWTPNAVPTTYNDILIPSSGVTNQPTISAASSAINAMTIQAGRVLTINSSLQLSTAADITTSGQIMGAGKLAFNGASFTQNGAVTVASVEFSAGAHTLAGGGAFASNIITVLNGASVTVTSNHAVSVIVINSGGAFDITGQTLTLTGAGTAIFNSGSFTATGSTVVYQGTVAQVVTADLAYTNLAINNAAGVSLAADTTVSGLLTLATDLTTGAFTLTQPASGSSTGAGDVIGNVKRTGFVNGAALSFGNPLNTIRFDSGMPPADVTVNLVKSAPAGFPANTVSRTYTITPNGGSAYSASLRLRYKDAELNGLNESALELWRYNGSAWQSPAGAATRDAAANWVEESGVTAFSPWAIAGPSGPTAVELISFAATSYDGGILLEWKTGLEVANLGFRLYRDEAGKRTPVTPQLIAGSALRASSTLLAGQSYAWWDSNDAANATYWLEDIDLGGQSNWHGPFDVKAVGGRPPARSQAALLSEIAANLSPAAGSSPMGRTAVVSAATPQQLATQASLAGRAAVKIYVRRDGWYHVAQRDLVAAGLNPSVDPRFLRLFAEGREQPLSVLTGKADLFDESAAIEFYGMGLDTASTDARVYWLIADRQPGLRIEQVKSDGVPSRAQSFMTTVERRDRNLYFAALLNGERENFFGALVLGGGVDQQLRLPHLDGASAQPALIDVSLQGVTTLAHRVAVYLNGAAVGEVNFDGQQQGAARIAVACSMLAEDANTIRLVAQNGASDLSLVDSIRISYPRTFMADDDQLRLSARSGEQVTVRGFTSAAIRVFDVTEPYAVEELIGEITTQKDGTAITVAPRGDGERTLIALADGRAARPALLKANQPSFWRNANQGASLVIITSRDLLPAFERLQQARRLEGYQVALVDVEDIYDEFNFGEKSPQALKDLLAFARSSWRIAPRFVLLAGDASYDPKDYLGFGDADLVPTKLVDTGYLETASDDWFADFDADGVAEMAVGRLPARSFDEAVRLVDKTIAYGQSRPLAEMLLVADSNDGFDFEAATTRLRELIPPDLRVGQINRGQMDQALAKKSLLDAIARGQKIVNYLGHGSANVWRGDLLTADDAGALTNADRLPLFVMMTCLNGYYQNPALDSLAESLLKAERGGAIAVWASSAMALPAEQVEMNRELYRQVFQTGGKAATLGEMIGRAKSAIKDRDVRLCWILLGDPTLKLK